MGTDKLIRQELTGYLQKPHTHGSIEDALKDLPENLMNVRPEGIPYSLWELLEHIRISLFDMVDFVRNPDYKELEWPKDYWPGNSVNPTKKMWDNSIAEFNKHMSDFEAMVNSPEFDLTAPIKHGTGQTVLREVLQIIDHNSYHIGQIISMRRALGAWK